jgi:hypothetical protein
MSNTVSPVVLSPSPKAASSSVGLRLWDRLWSVGQFLLALGGTVAFLVYLLVSPFEPPVQPVERVAPPPEVVSLQDDGRIRVEPGSPFDQKVRVVVVRKAVISEPMFSVTGRVVASLRPANGKGEDVWQFDSPEILTAFTDWQKAQADIAFNEVVWRNLSKRGQRRFAN